MSTYDSAYLHMEHLGDKFGLLVFDECHHLPGPAYALAARAAVAPFRLGLTATPERADGRHADFDELCGPIVYRKDIVDLSGGYLAPYETVRLTVELGPEDRRAHDEARGDLPRLHRAERHPDVEPVGLVGLHHPRRRAPTTAGGRWPPTAGSGRSPSRRRPSSTTSALLLDRHRDDRVLLFTQDNATAYALSRRFLVPIITHETRVRERSEILAASPTAPTARWSPPRCSTKGSTSPTANVAVVVSGSASVREHVQRLGRILRARAGKHALLYELVTANTAETFTSARRRDHSAYR